MMEQPIGFNVDIHQKLLIGNPHRQYFIECISEVLKLNELPMYIIDDIYTYCEFDTVLEAIEARWWIVDMRKKDQKHEHRNKEQFLNAQIKFAEMLKNAGMNGREREIMNIEYEPNMRLSGTYEDALKESKELLYKFLIDDCGTGQNRAKNIVNILEEI